MYNYSVLFCILYYIATPLALYPGSFPLSERAHGGGVQTIDYLQLRQDTSSQIAEQNHVDARLSKCVVNYHAEDKQRVIGLAKKCYVSV